MPAGLLLRHPLRFIATGFGSGLMPVAPGTAGTLVAVPLYLAVKWMPIWAYAALTLLLFVMGVWACRHTAEYLGVHDHPSIVWDEIVGYLVAMTGLAGHTWEVVVGFLLFRLMDILKPWPIAWVDRAVAGGFGIMLDDVIAGLYTAIMLHAVIFFR